jgi:hypothetical protein
VISEDQLFVNIVLVADQIQVSDARRAKSRPGLPLTSREQGQIRYLAMAEALDLTVQDLQTLVRDQAIVMGVSVDTFDNLWDQIGWLCSCMHDKELEFALRNLGGHKRRKSKTR